MNLRRFAPLILAAAAALSAVPHAAPVYAQEAAPAILWDKPERIVAYQLKRLTNAQLVALDRKADDPRYAPLFKAFLARKSIDRKFRQEAVDALAKLNKSDPVVELLNAIGLAEEDDKATPRELAGMLMAQKPEALAKQREQIASLAKESESDLVKQAAYAALAAADGKPDAAWQAASEAEGGLRALLGGVPLIADGKVRAAFFPLAQPLTQKAADEATQAAAIEAVSAMPGHEAEAFGLLADLVTKGQGVARDAAVRSIQRVPNAKWPKDRIEPLAGAVVELVKNIPADKRTEAPAAQAVQLGNDLAAALPSDKGLAVRKTLRELAVRTVLVRTLREQMQYDLRYFVVQAGKPVQVVLENADGMPHNIVFTAPGAMQEVAIAGQAITPTGKDDEKAYVPPSPKVVEASVMVQPEEATALTFTAPAQPGEYPFVCTFPGHWVRMYGVMLAVPDIDAWEQSPKAPNDPLTKKPYDGQKNDVVGGAGAAGQPTAHQH